MKLPETIETISVETLIPYARNSRTHSDAQVAQIAASIKEFGFTNPVLIDQGVGIIAGHGRVLAARKLGLPEVPCIRLGHLTDAQKRAYVLADNKLALNAGWDNDLLALELGELGDLGFDLELTGFSDDELADLLGDIEEAESDNEDKPIGEPVDEDIPDAPATPVSQPGDIWQLGVHRLICGDSTDPDEAPALPENPSTKPGDVWVMGKHRLLCGDSTSMDDLARLCQGQMVDMWLTDPPYNVAYEGGTKEKLTIKNDSMGDDQFRQFLRDAYTAADSVMKSGAVFYIWHADSEGYNFRGAAKDAGWTVRQCLIWKKSSLVLGRQDYQWQHEPCLYGWKEGASHLWASDRKQTTILEFDKPARNGEHPTMKPVALFEYQLLNNTKGGDMVLDSFGGSGTTLIAAEKNGRIARIMELDPKYCDVIVQRWQDFTGQTATLEADGRTFDEVKNGNEKAQN